MNILFLSADDMSYSSTGLAGCEFPNITPTLDVLANEGVFFKNAHTTVGLCQPSRSVWMTGLYPWNNGATGFNDVFCHVETLVEILHTEGYSTGIIGKAEHLGPTQKFCWNFQINGYSPYAGWGKDAKQYYQLTKAFLESTNKPFFLMVNSHFPHRPFEKKSRFPADQVKVPGFLPDTLEVRNELSLYLEGVARCDYTVKLVLQALKETGNYEDTLIIFTSDHGMAFPFMKACCYHFSTRVPLIWHYPKLFKSNTIEDYVSGVDIFPTILDFLGINRTVNGESYRKTIESGEPFKKEAYTCLCRNWSGEWLQTRAVHNKDYCYILNFWANGKQTFVEDGCLEDNPSLISLKSQEPKLYRKLRFRSPEEFYELQKDPFAINNIEAYSPEREKMRNLMNSYAVKTNDTLTLDYFKRPMFL